MVQRRGTVRGIPTNKTIKASYFDLGSPKHDTCEMHVVRKIDPNDPNHSFYRNRYSIEMSMGRANRWQMLQQWDDENSGGDNDDHHHTVSKSQVKKERIEQNRNEKKLAHEMGLHLKDKHKRKVLKKELSQNGNNSKDDEDDNRDENTSGDNSTSTNDKKVLKAKGGKNKKKRQESEEDDDEEEEETREMVRVKVGGLSDQRSGSGRTITVPGDELRQMARMNEHDQIDSVFITKTYDTEEKNRAGARNPIQDNRRDRDWIFEDKKRRQKSAKDWKSNLGVW